MSETDINDIIATFGLGSDGRIDVSALFAALRATMNERRRGLVQQAFERLDRKSTGVADLDDLRTGYDASRHPEVIDGRRTAEEASAGFLSTFNNLSNPTGYVPYVEFEAYYAGVSACVENDDYFELMMANCWNLDDLELEAMTRSLSSSSSLTKRKDLRSTLPPGSIATLNHKKPPQPKRIVGYTGHIPGAQDTFGLTFDQCERAAVTFFKDEKLPPPPSGYDLRTTEFPKHSGRLAINAHSYKLE
eukprot:CAMPEP_0174303600 /NCGR_PEP_ID=MMETSP0809-20121228/60280_1 /TAXON_ID=73025 ORGANISM="Eutreptiella gymnastica-like, Strain CCMP1594" /NCGR_SAMPLE_ID=MMETSP0809 /ASSEMBLY_ACC=CAM_ASM_000658 /LENGTH=246 /DNA_ID=CAMNT_0015409655 /DNA_START=221 /DNA_END=961 /DNA_ORIENTATION=-